MPASMCVPGAQISGFQRPSPLPAATGPRLENEATSCQLLAPVLVTPQPSVPVWRSFSPAPTVITFLAVPGVDTVFEPEPLLPAENTTRYCWLPAVPLCASRVRKSYTCEFAS